VPLVAVLLSYVIVNKFGVTAGDVALDAGLKPALLFALTLNVYGVPLVNDPAANVHVVIRALATTHVAPPGLAVTV
jgi:hypothetical protein